MVGLLEGDVLAVTVGSEDGVELGVEVGPELGLGVGAAVGFDDGMSVGFSVGARSKASSTSKRLLVLPFESFTCLRLCPTNPDTTAIIPVSVNMPQTPAANAILCLFDTILLFTSSLDLAKGVSSSKDGTSLSSLSSDISFHPTIVIATYLFVRLLN